MKIAKPINILVRRSGALGDTMMTTGIVRELRRRYGPDATIDFVTNSIEAYRNNTNINHIIPANLATAELVLQYDMYINLDNAYELNPQNQMVDSMFYRAFGSTDFDKHIDLFPDSADIALVDKALTQIEDKFIVVHMRNWHWSAKNIDMAVWFDIFERLLSERTDFTIVCTGGAGDHFIDSHPNFYDAREYNVQQLKYLCDHASCFVGIDSAPYHAAAASLTHIVSLSTLFHQYITLPYRSTGPQVGDNCTTIATREDCAGCWERQPAPVQVPVCEKGDTPCNKNFDTAAITQAILDSLK